MRTRPGGLTRTAAAAAALALLAAGCSGGDEDSPSSTSEASPTASPTPGPDPSAEPDAEGYLPAPEGVELTEPGTRLDLKDSAVIAWQPRQDLVGVVDVAVTRIDETTVQASLAGFDLDADDQRSTPYFVKLKVTNVGDTDLGARQLPVYFLDSSGVLVAPTGVARDFEACPGGVLPGTFAPGDRTTSCLIFLVPEGKALQSITFRPPDGVVPLWWKGPITSLGSGGKKDKKASAKRSGA